MVGGTIKNDLQGWFQLTQKLLLLKKWMINREKADLSNKQTSWPRKGFKSFLKTNKQTKQNTYSREKDKVEHEKMLTLSAVILIKSNKHTGKNSLNIAFLFKLPYVVS